MESKLHNPNTKVQVVVIPYPAQGHISPFMKLTYKLADHGVKVIFLTTEIVYARMSLATLPEVSAEQDGVRIVAVPDGLESEDDRKDEVKLGQSISRVLRDYLEDLIPKTNRAEGDGKITCVIADSSFGWAAEVAEKMGIKKAMFFTSSPGVLALTLHLPKLIEAGVINTDGSSPENNKIQLSPNLPAISFSEFTWICPGNATMQRIVFEFVLSVHQSTKRFNWVLCNWFHELDPSAENLAPNILPIGPLLAYGQPRGNFWMEDYSCLSWLNTQPSRSVIYVAFGSSSKFSQHQFEELAQGLELVRLPFLCVIRPDFTNQSSTSYLDEFTKRVANLGRMVQWAPQEMVLSHPSVACFVTHCGWNSSIEGVSMGVPLLCWPYFADQFYNKSCICEGWKVGLCLNPNEEGMVTRHEIKRKIDELLSNHGIRANTQKLKQLAQTSVSRGGSSANNLEDFVKQIRI